MRYVKIAAMMAIVMLPFLFTAGCGPWEWTLEPIQYCKSSELYDDRDGETIRYEDEYGYVYLVVKVKLRYVYNGNGLNPEDIRDSVTFWLVNPYNQLEHYEAFFEYESWDLYDAIDPIFYDGNQNIGSIFFKIPSGTTPYDFDIGITSHQASYPGTQLGSLPYIAQYPADW